RQETEDVVAAARLRFRGGEGTKLGVVDVIDCHLDVVALSPRRRPLVVEPAVVSRHDVAPLDDREAALERAGRVLERPGEGVAARRVAEGERGGSSAGRAQQPRPGQLRGGHHGGEASDVSVITKTAWSGTENWSVPVGPVSRKPISRLVPVPSAFQSTSRN